MKIIDADSELMEYLQISAREAGVSVSALLRQVLHVNPLTEEPGFHQVFRSLERDQLVILMRLDWRIRVLNPGLHYVFRNTYLGYRREGSIAATSLSSRSQIFASVFTRRGRLSVVLPVDPARYARETGCRVLTGLGHHGVGDLQVDIPDEDALERFFKTFSDWLSRPSIR